VHQADIGGQRDRQRLPRYPRKAMGQSDRGLLVHAQQQLGVRIAQVIDQAVVQAAETGPRGERDVGDGQRAQQIGDRVAAPAGSGRLGGAHGVSVMCVWRFAGRECRGQLSLSGERAR
jgi:hypothetical protein